MDSIPEATVEKFRPFEEREHHKMMAGSTLVATETVNAVSGQGTTTHIHLIEASGVLTSDPVAQAARPVWKERSAARIVNVVAAKSVAASEKAAVDVTGSGKANDLHARHENHAIAAGGSAALGTRDDLRDVKTAEAEAEEPQTMAGRGYAIPKIQAKEMQM
jgi:hypothetical protein